MNGHSLSLPPHQEHPFIVDNLDVVSIDSRGETRFVTRYRFFHSFSSLHIALLPRFQASALHPLIEGPLPSPDRLPQYLQPMLVEHVEEGGKAKRKGVGRVSQPFNLIEELKFRVALRGKGIEDQEPALGFRYTHHFHEHRF